MWAATNLANFMLVCWTWKRNVPPKLESINCSCEWTWCSCPDDWGNTFFPEMLVPVYQSTHRTTYESSSVWLKFTSMPWKWRQCAHTLQTTQTTTTCSFSFVKTNVWSGGKESGKRKLAISTKDRNVKNRGRKEMTKVGKPALITYTDP
jgi:hypothetical protein